VVARLAEAGESKGKRRGNSVFLEMMDYLVSSRNKKIRRILGRISSDLGTIV
jgi:hypothetical protein